MNTLTAIAATTALAAAAHAGPYDSWWACVDNCCLECPNCVDACTDEYNSANDNNRGEVPRFDIAWGYAQDSEIIVFQPGEPINLNVRRWLNGQYLQGRGDIVRVDIFSYPRTESMPPASTAQMRHEGRGVYEPAFDGYLVRIVPDSSLMLRAEVEYADGLVHTAVNVAIEQNPCIADWNGDTLVNTADFVSYLNDYAIQSGGGTPVYNNPDLAPPYGVTNTADFITYLNAYAHGC